MSQSHFDEILNALEISNSDLVSISTEQLTFKQVQKARAGKPLSVKVQMKILRALIAVTNDESYTKKQLFP